MGGSLTANGLYFNPLIAIRIILVGAAWGLALSAGLFVIALLQCGVPSAHDITITSAMCIGTGVLTLGPVVAFTGVRQSRRERHQGEPRHSRLPFFNPFFARQALDDERLTLLRFALALSLGRTSGAWKL
jgi:hypothetical protein